MCIYFSSLEEDDEVCSDRGTKLYSMFSEVDGPNKWKGERSEKDGSRLMMAKSGAVVKTSFRTFRKMLQLLTIVLISSNSRNDQSTVQQRVP